MNKPMLLILAAAVLFIPGTVFAQYQGGRMPWLEVRAARQSERIVEQLRRQRVAESAYPAINKTVDEHLLRLQSKNPQRELRIIQRHYNTLTQRPEVSRYDFELLVTSIHEQLHHLTPQLRQEVETELNRAHYRYVLPHTTHHFSRYMDWKKASSLADSLARK